MVGIYKITDTRTDFCYIGKSIDIFARWSQHMKQAETALESEDRFHWLLAKDPTFFKFEVLIICEPKDLDAWECVQLDLHKDTAIFNKIAAARTWQFYEPKKSELSHKEKTDFISNLIGKPLFVEDKEKIAEILNYRNSRGDLLKWRTVKQKLIESGLNIKETKRKKDGILKNCSIIEVNL